MNKPQYAASPMSSKWWLHARCVVKQCNAQFTSLNDAVAHSPADSIRIVYYCRACHDALFSCKDTLNDHLGHLARVYIHQMDCPMNGVSNFQRIRSFNRNRCYTASDY